MLSKHKQQIPPVADSIKGEYLLVLNTFNEGLLLHSTGLTGDWTAKLDHELVARSWQVPWERERALRIINGLFARGLEVAAKRPWEVFASEEKERDERLFHASPRNGLLEYSIWSVSQFRSASRNMDLCRLGAARLKLALALYQLKEGKPAKKLADLVPRFLAKLPTDVFTGKPFHYRVSKGERLNRLSEKDDIAPKFRDVPAGQGIVWCVIPLPRVGHGESEWVERGDDGYHLLFFVPNWPTT
jgi:hypothetical protein